MSADVQNKALAAGAQLQQALESAADAFKVIASAIPSLLPQDAQESVLPVAPKVATSPEAKSTPNKRKRKEKDLDAPDKPISAYHLWSKNNKDKIKASMPGTPSASEVVAELNRVWKELADGVKKPFQEVADKDKARYKQEITAYAQSKNRHGSDGIPAISDSNRQPSPIKKTILAKGGFTAVKAAPLPLNPELESESDHDSEDVHAVAADLGDSQPSPSSPESKRHKKEEGVKRRDPKEKPKEKEKNREKRKRRKSETVDS